MMGHYYAEMFPNGRKSHMEMMRDARRQEQDMDTQLEEVIAQNEITVDDINIGDKLILFPELFEHKIRHADHYGDFTLADYVKEYKLKPEGIKGFGFGRARQDQIYTAHQIGENREFCPESGERIRLSRRPSEGAPGFVTIPSLERWGNVKYFSKVP